MRVSACVLVAAWIGLAAATLAEPPEPKLLFEQAQAAVLKLKAVTYEAEFRGEGYLPAKLRGQRGTVTLVRQAKGMPKMRLDAGPLGAPQGTPPRMQLTSDGLILCAVDHQKKQYLRGEGTDPYIRASVPQTGLLLNELYMSKPFAREIEAESLKYLGRLKVHGVECHVIRVILEGGKTEIAWYLGVEDQLPHRVERTLTFPMGKGTMMLELRTLEANPKVEDDLFRLERPAGYTDPPPPQQAGPGNPQPLVPGSAAPDWSLQTPEGKAVTLKGLRGKVVVLDFWSTWCRPCIRDMPGIQKLHERFKDKPVEVFGVHCWKRPGASDPVEFMKKRQFTYGLLLRGDDVAKAFGVTGIPAHFVIGPDGKIVHAHRGGGKEDLLVEAVEKAVKGMEE